MYSMKLKAHLKMGFETLKFATNTARVVTAPAVINYIPGADLAKTTPNHLTNKASK